MSQEASAVAFRQWQKQHGRRLGWPSWLMSLVFHAVLVIVLAMTLEAAPRGTGFEVTRDGDVVLRREGDDEHPGEFYEGEGDSQATPEAPNAAASPLENLPPSSPADALPAPNELIGPAAAVAGGRSVAGTIPAASAAGGGRARVQVFGIPSEGYKFVYLFDRSGSMGGSGRNALNRAKAELLTSLENLGEIHQFQIIFYNETPTMFPLSGPKSKLVFANAANKTQAANFVRGIVAEGATEHRPALLAALALNPDVIFFLTDAGRPEISPSELAEFTRRNRAGAKINVIEFGMGPTLGDENFLVKLAKMNNGEYAYVDVTANPR